MTKIKKYFCRHWSISELMKPEDIADILLLIRKGYTLISADTETSGLHIILDKAFCLTFALVNLEERDGKAFIIDLRKCTEKNIKKLEEVLMSGDKLIFWNAKYDMHMLYNVGMHDLINYNKITDAMIYARLANDALIPDKGGVNLSLKAYSMRTLDSDAKVYEHELASYKKNILIKRNEKLKDLGVKIGDLNKFLKDKINDIYDLDPAIIKILTSPEYNQNDYRNIPWDILKKYAAFDAIFTIENYIRDIEIVKQREQMKIAEIEELDIPILWEMERNGFSLNTFYLNKSKWTMKNYIIEQRERLNTLVGQPIKINQHDLIKKIFENKYNITLAKSDEDALKQIKGGEAEEVAKIIIELRTLEKWYSTYICKWETYAKETDRIYTSFNQCGAVSGRFSCDFQQFPKEPIYKANGELLYSPRKIVKVSGDDYDMLALIDYSSEELRIQALYTILVGDPDRNLCRAYMPMECTEKDGKWYLNEDMNTEWHPTDLHTLTTLTAFPDKKETDPDFGHYRKLGKCTNFA